MIWDPQKATRTVPAVVTNGDAVRAFAMASSVTPVPAAALPEAMTLLATPHLSALDRAAMVRALAPDIAGSLTPALTRELADCAAHIGVTGFSFPRWRFTAQGFDGPSLMERFGLQRLTRPTDRFDTTRPPTPQNDHFGTGFVRHTPDFSIEYRRAYILCANRRKGEEAVLVMRNNSPFFGRDRLSAPAFAAYGSLPADQCDALADHDFGAAGRLRPWLQTLAEDDGVDVAEKIRRTQRLLTLFETQERAMDAWLRGDAGRDHVAALVTHSCAKMAQACKTGVPFYLAAVSAAMPPWQPQGATAATPALARALTALRPARHKMLKPLFDALAQPGMRLDILSGPYGDFPQVALATPTKEDNPHATPRL